MKYTNITKNLSFINAEDKSYSKKELIMKFEEFLMDSGYRIEKWIDNKRAPYELLVIDPEDKMIHMVVYLKNITGAGWADKLNIKRVQVSNIRIVDPDNYVGTSNYQTLLILGYYNFDDNPIMVAWDAYRYVQHKTMRSCYVNVESLKRGYQNGYFVGTDSSQKIWVFDHDHFDKFLNNNIEYNKN